MRGKKGVEFSFGWLFALIVGAAIIFLAIYAAIKLVGTEREVLEAGIAKELGIILTPVETGLEEGKVVGPIKFASETRVYNNCTLRGSFGEQKISTASSSGIGKKWEVGMPITFTDKYIFSSNPSQGTSFYAFSKPFEMPFRVASLLYLWNDKEKYCFVGAPTSIEDEVSSFTLRNINLTEEPSKCPRQSITVCFGYSSCNVSVSDSHVTKNGKNLYYGGSDALLYAAVFSEPEVYECQMQRLMKRTSQLASIYASKTDIVSGRTGGCSSNLKSELEGYATSAAKITNSEGIGSLRWQADSLGGKNDALVNCKLWED